jgi:hypothetical protein
VEMTEGTEHKDIQYQIKQDGPEQKVRDKQLKQNA